MEDDWLKIIRETSDPADDLDVVKILKHLEIITAFVSICDFENAFKVYELIKKDLNLLERINEQKLNEIKINGSYRLNNTFLIENKDVTDLPHFGYGFVYWNAYVRNRVWKDDEGYAYIYNIYNRINYSSITYLVDQSKSNYEHFVKIPFSEIGRKSQCIYIDHSSSNPNAVGIAVCVKIKQLEVLSESSQVQLVEAAQILTKRQLFTINLEWQQYVKYLNQCINLIKEEYKINRNYVRGLFIGKNQNINGFFEVHAYTQGNNSTFLIDLFNLLYKEFNYLDLSISLINKHFNVVYSEFIDDVILNELTKQISEKDFAKVSWLIRDLEDQFKNKSEYYSGTNDTCGCGESPCVCSNSDYC